MEFTATFGLDRAETQPTNTLHRSIGELVTMGTTFGYTHWPLMQVILEMRNCTRTDKEQLLQKCESLSNLITGGVPKGLLSDEQKSALACKVINIESHLEIRGPRS